MKKIVSVVLTTILYSYVLVLSGCSVDTTLPPPSSGGGGGSVGAPQTVAVTLGASNIANGGSTTVTAVVRDSSLAVVPNATVAFSVISAGAGTLNPSTAVTNASGVATSLFTAVAPDTTATIRATVSVGLGTISGSAQITIGTPARVPSSVVVTLGTSTIGNGGNTTATATVSDALGVISGVNVTFSVSVPGAGSFTAAAPTDAAGQTTVTFTASSPAGDNSTVNITATAGAVSNSAVLTIGSPPPPTPTSASITINPLSISIQSQANVSVTVLGATGPAFSVPVTLTITSGAPLASFASGTAQSTIGATTNASGIASATIYSGASSGAVTVTATVAGLAPVQASFFITSAPASIALNVTNSNLNNGQTTNITATVLNVLSQPVTDGTVVEFSITSLAPFAGQLSAASASTVNGIASVTFTADATITGGVIIQVFVAPLAAVQTIIIVNAAQAGSLEFISVSPSTGVIDIGGASALLTFKVLDINGTPRQGQTVNFQLAVFPFGTTVTPASGSTGADGTVTTTLTSGSVAGPVRIIANTTVQGTATVLYASSAPLSVGGGVPSMRFFSISLAKLNVPGLNCDGVTDTINVKMADRFGNYNILAGTAVSFATSFGAINTSNITDNQGQTASVWRSQDPRPTDGQVAILVQTTGEENFTDLNADGVYSAGTDGFNTASVPVGDDLPEPFIDANHNSGHDVGELFFDWPTGVPTAVAGTYNTVNGVWDGNIPIFENINICMTGPPDVNASNTRVRCCDPITPNCVASAAVASSITIPAGGYTTCYAYGADENGNPLASETTVSLTSSKSEASIEWVDGFLTYGDFACGTPAITGFTVTNDNASTTADVTATLFATIRWSSPCGSLETTFSYPGAVTLTHP